MTDEAASKPDKYDLRLTQSIEDLRSNVKWTLVAFGAIGTTLLAGSQLSSLGKFPLQEPRLWAAIIFATAALGAAAYAVWSALKVANAGYVEFYNLDPADVEYVQRNAALLEGFGTIDNLRDWYNTVIEERHACLTHSPVDEEAQASYEIWFNYLDGLVDTVVSYIHYNRIRQQAEKSRTRLIFASIVAAIALLGFAWAANPKEEKPVLVLQSPASAATLTLTDEGKKALTPLLGASCTALSQIEVIILNVTTAGSEVVTLTTKDCPLARFTVTGTLGRLAASSAGPAQRAHFDPPPVDPPAGAVPGGTPCTLCLPCRSNAHGRSHHWFPRGNRKTALQIGPLISLARTPS